MTDALFGPNACVLPKLGIPVAGSLIDAQIGPPKMTKRQINLLFREMSKIDRSILVCTNPPGGSNPCNGLLTKLKNAGYIYKPDSPFLESGTGPQINIFRLSK